MRAAKVLLPLLDFRDVRLIMLLQERWHVAGRELLSAAARPVVNPQRQQGSELGIAGSLKRFQTFLEGKRAVVALTSGSYVTVE